jgi:hypothetical protein
MFKPLPSQSKLKDLFFYDPMTGIFTYKYKPNFRFRNNAVAGTVKKSGRNKGRCLIKIEGQLYSASRLAWMYYYGEDPGELTVDHIDKNPSNNAIVNLRLATLSQQCFNRHLSVKSSGLPRGVWFNPKDNHYRATFNCKATGYINKNFLVLEDAVVWLTDLRNTYGGEFAEHSNESLAS